MRVQFGGPDKPAGALASLLNECIENVPAGGEIHWITYYFGNLGLAQSLLAASRRGVRVYVDVDAHPRRPQVNKEVIRCLREFGSGSDARVRELKHIVPCHVHEKLYYFSHPRPVVYAGSYNPSCGEKDPPELVEDIGDQDRGHNFLVEIGEAAAVSFIRNHMQAMHRLPHGPLERFKDHLNAEHHSSELSIWLYPRRRSSPHIDVLNDRSLTRIRVAASHFRDPTIAHALGRLAAGGSIVEVLCHESLRRVPEAVERLLSASGVHCVRYRHAEGLPMHNKFMLLEGRSEVSVLFGSLNLTRTSRWLNHEVLMKTSHHSLLAAFLQRWKEMFAELRMQSSTA
jgi:phosphatidylserine/phosphatidylglycerophosphate/cardiolipin synthase-like enzyme